MTPVSLQTLFDRCTEIMPILAGCEHTPATHQADEATEMAMLFHQLAQTYPQAGEIYWGCRTWQLWLWQPVYFSVWSALLFSHTVCLDDWRQNRQALFVAGFSLPPQQPHYSDTPEQDAVSALRRFIEQRLPLLQPLYPLTPKLADYYLGDAVLKALAAAHRFACADKEQILLAKQRWLAVLGGRCRGRLLWQDSDQTFHAELAACCQHDRRDGTFCDGCPKTRKSRCSCV